jgi:hypothetical protein
MGTGGIAPSFLTSALDGGEWSASRPSPFTPGKRSPVTIESEAVWAPEQVWIKLRREKSLATARNRTPAVQPVARPYTN